MCAPVVPPNKFTPCHNAGHGSVAARESFVDRHWTSAQMLAEIADLQQRNGHLAEQVDGLKAQVDLNYSTQDSLMLFLLLKKELLESCRSVISFLETEVQPRKSSQRVIQGGRPNSRGHLLVPGHHSGACTAGKHIEQPQQL